jgi:predicted transcriptional regulator
MSRHFLVSLSDLNLERVQHKDWRTLLRDPDWKLRAQLLERLRGYLERLPALERDVVELYYGLHPGGQPKKQEVIANLLGISQQAVSHRLYNAFKRIQFMMNQPDIDPAKMKTDLASELVNPFTVEVLCDFAFTSSQTATAKNLSVKMGTTISQQRICWHLNSAVRLLQESGSIEAIFYMNYFLNLMRNRNILREVLAGRRRKVDEDAELRSGSAAGSDWSGLS